MPLFPKFSPDSSLKLYDSNDDIVPDFEKALWKNEKGKLIEVSVVNQINPWLLRVKFPSGRVEVVGSRRLAPLPSCDNQLKTSDDTPPSRASQPNYSDDTPPSRASQAGPTQSATSAQPPVSAQPRPPSTPPPRPPPPPEFSDDEPEEEAVQPEAQPVEVRRSGRIRRPPDRLNL